MTGGAGDTFAILPGMISTAKEVSSTSFTLNNAHFTLPKGKMVVGIDVVGDPGSKLQPKVSSVDDPAGHPIRGTTRAVFNPKVTRTLSTGDKHSSALLVPLSVAKDNAQVPATFSVKIQGLKDTTGKFLVGFYLPGDTDGNGVVDAVDVKAVRAALGSNPNGRRYNFEADADRDGRINSNDLQITQHNQGVKTTVSPIVSANLDPASDTGVTDRKTSLRVVHFTGKVTPGATVTYAETTKRSPAVSTKADDDGSYSIMVPLADGVNSFRVSTQDAFGQSISGGIEPVTYTPPESAAPALTGTVKPAVNGTNPT